MIQQRPHEPVVMRPSWHHLLFLHWPVSTEQLRPLVPPELEIDLYDGQACIGLIPFSMTRVRPHWMPDTPLRRAYENFHETNVRTYVHRNGRDPGVWFFSLDAANAAAVIAARLWYRLPYFYAQMRLWRTRHGLKYFSRRLWPHPKPAMCAVHAAPTGEAAPAPIGSFEHFCVERYILYSQSHGQLFMGRVHHAPYQLQPAKVLSLRENLVAAAGIARPHIAPHACYARRTDVEIFPPHRI